MKVTFIVYSGQLTLKYRYKYFILEDAQEKKYYVTLPKPTIAICG